MDELTVESDVGAREKTGPLHVGRAAHPEQRRPSSQSAARARREAPARHARGFLARLAFFFATPGPAPRLPTLSVTQGE
jgi:hypothetical protein